MNSMYVLICTTQQRLQPHSPIHLTHPKHGVRIATVRIIPVGIVPAYRSSEYEYHENINNFEKRKDELRKYDILVKDKTEISSIQQNSEMHYIASC